MSRYLLLVCLCAAVPAAAAEFYVSPTGRVHGSGGKNDPLDLPTALSNPSDGRGRPLIGPGDTVWLREGVYFGGQHSLLRGEPGLPVVVRQYPGERAVIDLRSPDEIHGQTFTVGGGHIILRDFEVTCSSTRREVARKNDDPLRGTISARGDGIRFVNLFVHDLGAGICMWSDGEGGEVYGCVLMNNGWRTQEGERGHGHGLYIQNAKGVKRLADNIVINQFSCGIHCYGSERAPLVGFLIEGNVCVNNGCLTRPDHRTWGIGVLGGSSVARATVRNNFLYGGSLQCGYTGAGNRDVAVLDNYVVGNVNIRDFVSAQFRGNTIVGRNGLVMLESAGPWKLDAFRWDDNRYYGARDSEYPPFQSIQQSQGDAYRLAEWRTATGLDANSVYEPDPPRTSRVFVRRNEYEAGRAHVIVYNWERRGEVEVDLAEVLEPGMAFRIVSAQNVRGPVVLQGVYRGEPIRLPLAPVPAVKPIGLPDAPVPQTEPEFGVFLVTRAER